MSLPVPVATMVREDATNLTILKHYSMMVALLNIVILMTGINKAKHK